MSTFPLANYLSNATRNEGEIKLALEDWLAATKQIPGAGLAESTLTLAGDAVAPPGGTGGIFSLDTEGAAPTDELKNITPTHFPDGSLLLLRIVNSTRTIKVKHSGGGSGQISLNSAGDFVLADQRHWLLLKQTGGLWEEVWRVPNADLAPIQAKTSSYTTTPQDRGRLIDMSAAIITTVTLLPVATAGRGFIQYIKNSGTQVVTVDPTGAEVIDGTGALDIHPNGSLTAVCDGATWKTIARQQPVASYYESSGQVSKNNTATPNTKIDLFAEAITLWDKNRRNTVVIENPGTITLDKALDNTNPNGRDQSAAFSVSSWVHAYWVWNPAIGVRGRLSVSPPPTGPAFVAGEDWWCYAGPWRIDASGNFRKSRMTGRTFTYDDSTFLNPILPNGTATTQTSVSTASQVAPNATNVRCSYLLAANLNSAGDNVISVTIFLVASVNYIVLQYTQQGFGAAHGYSWSGYFEIPNVGQNFIYQWGVGSATGQGWTVYVLGFDVQNNG